jgi:hypothetical protein
MSVARQFLVRLCMLLFVLAIALSVWAYPGGTWWDRARIGHSFWENFLCDLLHHPALNHSPNLFGARTAAAGMLVFVLGLSIFWSTTDRLLCCLPRLSKLVATLGVVGTPLVAAVPLLPSNRFPSLHTAAVTLGGLPAMLALLLISLGFCLEPHISRSIRAATLGFASLVIVCLGLYAREAVFGGASLRIVPVLERLASIATILWVLTLTRKIELRR